MGFVGAIVGFVLGFLAGQFVLTLILAGGRHLYVRENPSIWIWLGFLNLVIASLGAWLGYLLLQGV